MSFDQDRTNMVFEMTKFYFFSHLLPRTKMKKNGVNVTRVAGVITRSFKQNIEQIMISRLLVNIQTNQGYNNLNNWCSDVACYNFTRLALLLHVACILNITSKTVGNIHATEMFRIIASTWKGRFSWYLSEKTSFNSGMG